MIMVDIWAGGYHGGILANVRKKKFFLSAARQVEIKKKLKRQKIMKEAVVVD